VGKSAVKENVAEGVARMSCKKDKKEAFEQNV
jgi:hypothetical protein